MSTRLRVAALICASVCLFAAAGCTTPPPSPLTTAVGGDYSVTFASPGTVTIHQSGTGSAAVFTISVKSPFSLEGSSCFLSAGTVLATFTGSGPTYSESIRQFSQTTCSQINTIPGTVVDHGDGTLDIGTLTGTKVLTKTRNASTVPNPTPAGNYSVNINGSTGTVAVHQAGTGAAAHYTATVTTGFKLDNHSCTLSPSSVLATFDGSGPTFASHFVQYGQTSCIQANTVTSVAYLNSDNSLTIAFEGGVELLTRTVNGATVASPSPLGTYAVNINGSTGTVTVTGTPALYSATVTTGFKLDNHTCTLPSGAVVATFSGAGPAFTGSFRQFGQSSCTPINTVPTDAYLNSDNSLTIRLEGGIEFLSK